MLPIMNKLLIIILASFLLNSCAVFYHYKDFGEVPKKPGRYPEFTANDYLAGTLDEYRAGYDVSFYDLNLSINPEKKTIGGEVIIHFKALKNLGQIRFDLYENLDIDSIKFTGRLIRCRRLNRAVFVDLPDSLIPGQNYSLAVYYFGKPLKAKNPPWDGGMVWKKDPSGNPWVGITCETEGGSIWFPCKDHLSDEPDSVRLRITVPSGLKVVSNGTLEDRATTSESEIYTWKTLYPVNIYNITFYVGKFEHFNDTLNMKEGVLNLDYYVLPEHLDTAKQHFKQVKDILNLYSRVFGPYPWIREGFKLVESPFEGMEHQTAIAFGSGFYNDRWLGGDYIIVHEAAHEWWGNAVSVSDFSDIWLQEGFATYSEIVFAEHKLGYNASLLYAGYRLAGMVNNKLPVVGPHGVNYWDHKDNDVYNKGALILHTIRNVVNDSAVFFDILQTFYREHSAGSHVSSEDFIEVVERKTGADWSKFFEAYLNSREIPVLEWYFGIYEGDKSQDSSKMKKIPFFLAKWSHVPDGFNMPVILTGNDCEASVTFNVSTKPEVCLLPEMDSCSALSYNKRYSYFNAIENTGLLKEVE
jgi:aminopeptidase N